MNQHQMKCCGLDSEWSLDMKGVAVNGGYGNIMYGERPLSWRHIGERNPDSRLPHHHKHLLKSDNGKQSQ